MGLATVAALLAAAAFALAAALLHRSAELAHERVGVARADRPDPPAGGAPGGGGVVRFVASNARQPTWLLGMLVELVGFGLHGLAVHSGPLTLVQPLLVSSLVFALPIRQLLVRRRPSGAEIRWAALLAAGLTAFLLAATPTEGPATAPDTLPAALSATAGVVLIAVSVAIGAGSTGRRAAASLGAGAGVAFATVAALLKVVTDEITGPGVLAMLADWPAWALVAVAVVGLVLTQLAYRAAPLRYSLPALSTVNPLVSLVIGAAVFDEPFRHSAVAVAAEVVGLVVVVVGVVALSQQEAEGPAPAGEVAAG